MRLGLGLRRRRGGAGGGGGSDTTAPAITNLAFAEPYISFDVSEACTIRYLVNASATPLTGAAIKAAVIAATPAAYGTFSAPEGPAETTPTFGGLAAGDWYLHLCGEDAGGNITATGAVFAFTIAAAPSNPQVTALAQGGTFNSSLTVSVPATAVGDQIVIFLFASAGGVPSCPNWTVRASRSNSGGFTAHVLTWDGTGTRPNASNVTVTLSGNANASWQVLVVDGGGIGNVASGETGPSGSHTTTTLTASANSLILYSLSRTTGGIFDITAPATSPDTDANLTPPSSTGRYKSDLQNVYAATLAYPVTGAGTIPAAVATSSFSYCSAIIVEVLV